MQLKIERSFSKLKNDWSRLYDITPEVSPFLNVEAMRIALKYFYPYYIARKCKPLFCVFYKNNTICAIIPMLKYHTGKLQLFGDVNGFNESGIVYESESLLPECLNILKENFKEIEFVKIDERTPIVKFRTDSAKKTSNVSISFPKDFESYFATLSKSVRQNIRTAYNRLKVDEFESKLEVYVGGGNNLPINQIIDLYCNRHNDRYGVKTSWLKKWFLKTHNFATRYYRFSPNATTFMLYIDGKPAAFMSGLTVKSRIIIPRLSIDNNFKRYSPGMLLVVEAIKYLQQNTNVNILDLSQGEEEYKYQLGGQEHLSYRFML